MTKIVVTITKNLTAPLPDGVTFEGTTVAVVDNSGAKLTAVTLNGTESPPWQAVFTGAVGTLEATATIQDIDTNGNDIGAAIVLTESGTGGQPQTFAASTGGTITVS